MRDYCNILINYILIIIGDDIAQCPMCGELFGSAEIEQHVSVCLPPDDIDEEYVSIYYMTII
jgi:hypothetical protein